MAGSAGKAMVCVAQVGAAHGVRGAFRVRCFTEAPENVAAYGPLCDAQGNELFALRILGAAKGGLIASVDGIKDRDAAEALRGARLYVPRSRLPAPDEDEFYHEDLVGLVARDEAGQSVGKVTAVLNFGAGDILEITAEGGETKLVPFTREAVPVLDFTSGFVQVVPPTELPTGEAAA